MLKNADIKKWFLASLTDNVPIKYRHQLLKEDDKQRPAAVIELKKIITQIHDEIINEIHQALDINLDPLDDVDFKFEDYYPAKLPLTTLKGYFGEILTGVLVENYSPFGQKDWIVPVSLFKYHNLAFDALEKLIQSGKLPSAIYGRTGNDVLAFQIDFQKSEVIKVLVCEAKCTNDHDSSLINAAHAQASSAMHLEVLRIIKVLNTKTDSESILVRRALSKFYVKRKNTTHERLDLVCYICGKFPVKEKTWISPDKLNANYTGNRKLEVLETHISKINDLIIHVYEESDK